AVGALAAFTVDFTSPAGSTRDFNHAGIDLTGLDGRSVAVETKVATTTSASIDLSAWIDIDNDELKESSDKFPSTTEKVTFYDPSAVSVSTTIERFVHTNATTNVFNADADTALGVALAFSPVLNLDQIDFDNAKISFALSENSATAGAAVFTKTGVFGYSNNSKLGKVYGTLTTTAADEVTANELDAGASIVVTTTKENGATDVVSRSGGYTVPAQESTSTNVSAIGSIAATPSNDNLQTDSSTDTFALRTGTKTFTYTATAGAVKANVPVLATVQATTIATGGKVTAANRVLVKDEVAIFAGTTDANGKYSVQVTSDLAKAGESYKVKFYVLSTAGVWTAFDIYTATYAGAVPTTVTPSSTIVAGADVAVNFSVKDQFSQLISANAAGKALYVEARATNTSNLKSYVPVINGVAALSFKNYLATGGSDTITWTLGTGANATDFVSAGVATNSISLYNPAAAAGVNAISSQTTTITYDDFITGAVSATNVAPNDGGTTISGTVVDSNGAGIPGAVVTIAADGLQFQKTGGDYYIGSITTSADAAGAFSVNVWSHIVSSTGIAVKITSNGKSATTTLKTYLPSTGVNGNNLVFSVNLPSLIVKNTTYAVTAKLADKWGNPIATTVNGTTNGVSFQGSGSVEINSSSSAVAKNFDKNGIATVFLRSVKDVAGPGSLTATLGGAYYAAGSTPTNTALVVSEIATDSTATKWDETKFKNAFDLNVEVLESAPVVSATVAGTTGSVNVTVRNAAGKAVTVTINGRVYTPRLPSAAAQWYTFRGFSAGAKSVVVKVAGKTVATRTVTVK
ncbi:MAG: hypothetical protein RI933_1213, partial [Actinomycetota bacterium]